MFSPDQGNELKSFTCDFQRYVELFRSTKGEMMTAVQQRMYGGMFSGVGGFSQFGVNQVSGQHFVQH